MYDLIFLLMLLFLGLKMTYNGAKNKCRQNNVDCLKYDFTSAPHNKQLSFVKDVVKRSQGAFKSEQTL